MKKNNMVEMETVMGHRRKHSRQKLKLELDLKRLSNGCQMFGGLDPSRQWENQRAAMGQSWTSVRNQGGLGLAG